MRANDSRLDDPSEYFLESIEVLLAPLSNNELEC